ncbi:MAG: hypothetical protein V1793_03055 [Pseudomonadota bacterium]
MKHVFFLLGAILLTGGSGFADTGPLTLGGFTLGKDISNYISFIDEGSFRKVRYSEYIGEAEIKSVPGFVSGSIAFGLCDQPKKIVRIKLKYDDPTREFFDQLLKRVEASFGEPQEYKGDPFQAMIAWKWSFETMTHGNISLILQHNTKNPDEKFGNAVKLTLTGQIELERMCMQKKSQENPGGETDEPPMTEEAMWKRYVPY